MKESIENALSWIKSNAQRLGLTPLEAKVSNKNPQVKIIKSDEEREFDSKI